MRSIYDDLPKLKINFGLGKFIATIVAVNLFLVLPISLIESNKGSTNSDTIAIADDGRVLGLNSIDTLNQIPSNEYRLLGVNVDFSSENGLLVSIGLILLTISFLILIFLIIDNYRSKKLNKF